MSPPATAGTLRALGTGGEKTYDVGNRSLLMTRETGSAPRRAPEPPCRQCVIAGTCPVAVRQDPCAPEAGYIAPQVVPRDRVLQHEGERTGRVAFVKSGLMAVAQARGDGQLRPIAVIGPGNLIGQSELVGQPAVFTVRALTPVSLCMFSPALLEAVLTFQGRSVPALLNHNARMVVSTLADWSGLMRLPGLDQRFALALKLIAEMQPSGTTQLPAQGALAELMGVARESINRVWRDFQARGLVRRRHRHGVDLDLERIERLLQSAD